MSNKLNEVWVLGPVQLAQNMGPVIGFYENGNEFSESI
jgi:hypothetical protein